MTYKDYADSLDKPFEFMIRGKKYVVPPVSAKLGQRLTAIANVGQKAIRAKNAGEDFDAEERAREILDDSDEAELYRDLLTPAVYERILNDPKATWEDVKRTAMTVLARTLADDDAAEKAWAGELGKGKRPAPADHKPPRRKAGTSARSRSTAAASSTRSRASTRGTTSRKV